ncbi:hypothetical protein CMV_005815 [Castanea mollissima]|uniref:Uncharacterized protein n=1 Tax=Castanea mollissima TaxID=60419 RepID=A0A8J4VU68_9ROSI|nr:hypothetical protein CMV_005815 [Castanea mollissima]
MIPISIHSHSQRKLKPLDQISRKHSKGFICYPGSRLLMSKGKFYWLDLVKQDNQKKKGGGQAFVQLIYMIWCGCRRGGGVQDGGGESNSKFKSLH